MNSKKRVELPLYDCLYSTYHNQSVAMVISSKNDYMKNWHLNQVFNLTCSRKFLNGFTTPQIHIVDSSWFSNPFLEKRWFSTQFINGYINPIIRQLLDNGYYVAFSNVDDYYIKGKSFYKKRHFGHDGMICGYDQNDKTYCIYAYDSNWVYRKFWVPQKDFNAGMAFMAKKGLFSSICGVKSWITKVDFSLKIFYDKLKEYLDSNLEKYPFEEEGEVYGIVVHRYIAEYVLKLYKQEIPYEKMDWRIFRLIWEHKKSMLERITKTEEVLKINNEISEKYKLLVAEADMIRMLYASHRLKRRDAVLPIIHKKLLALMEEEKFLLTLLLEKIEEGIKDEIVEVSKE